MATQTVNVKNLKKFASLKMMEANPECPSGSEHFPGDQVKSAFLLKLPLNILTSLKKNVTGDFT